MDKKRDLDDNWYMLPMDERKKLMRDRGMIGRQYAGKIKQFISGSQGLDKYEWGVTYCQMTCSNLKDYLRNAFR